MLEACEAVRDRRIWFEWRIKMGRWILYMLCWVLGWAGIWPLYLGIAKAHSGLGFADYGPLLILGIAQMVVGTAIAVWIRYGSPAR